MGPQVIAGQPAVQLLHEVVRSPSLPSAMIGRVQQAYSTTSSFFSSGSDINKKCNKKKCLEACDATSSWSCHVADAHSEHQVILYRMGTMRSAHLKGEVITLNPRPDVQLDGIHFRYENQGQVSQKHIIYFLPNGALFKDLLNHLHTLAERSHANLTCYNYRGTGSSSGTLLDENDLLNDGRAIVNSVLQNAATSRELVFHGYSMGGGVATQLAAEYSRDLNIHLVNERSYTSLPNVATNLVLIAGRVAGWILSLCSWRLDSDTNLQNFLGRLTVISANNDGMMRGTASFAGICQNRANTTHIQINGDHCSQWGEAQYDAYVHALANR